LTVEAVYDFVVWRSFPSSAKLVSDRFDELASWPRFLAHGLSVKRGAKLTVQFYAKQENVLGEKGVKQASGVSRLSVYGSADGKTWKYLSGIALPPGTFDWQLFSGELTVPSDVAVIRLYLGGGWGAPGRPGVTWVDDVKIYQDGALIYSEDFSNWSPYIGAGLGAVAGGVGGYLATGKPEYALAALPVALVGGIIGWLTAKP
jgi:hypothetical protein